ncbi:T9SS type A sorting domain-containing protein [uncultured Flavobacterium sp.]|uniref:T9SS type A sorting domain-containing protein n=1 Tax=uncultured Flavobacterium sp. TaxID=165435 RepID=UPI0030EC6874|tara:strand:+ start:17789 stop:18262 length:474 start_codon:yes stop_codon:yes gene_type:complete
MIKLKILAILFCVTHSIYSQKSLTALGGEATGSGGTLSYSVGQLANKPYSGINGTTMHGVQQSIELYTLSNPEFKALTLTAATYPNPTTDHIVLKLMDSNLTSLNYTLYDIQGRTVSKGQVLHDATQITMQHLEMGIYILKVNQNSKELKSFKIIKH